MPNKFQALLDALSDGGIHSGEDLGRELGISRTAVWKHLQKLEELDLVVERVKGQGYRIPGGYELLRAETILANLSNGVTGSLKQLDILHSVDSTNKAALERAEKIDRTGCVVLAEHQTAGRGRRGRSWVSPFARNVYLSLVWGFEGGATALEGLSLAVGVAARRAIVECGVNDVQLKWPNDILHRHRKLGGILLEMIGDPAGFCQVVIGIGINVSMSPQSGQSIDQQWTDLCRAAGNQQVSRNRLVAELLNQLLPMLGSYHKTGFSAIRSEWEQSDAYRGKPVKLITSVSEVSGIAEGVSETGSICLNVGGTRQFFNGGEVSLKGVAPHLEGASDS